MYNTNRQGYQKCFSCQWFMLRFWLNSLGNQIVIHLILIVKTNQAVFEKKINLNLSNDDKRPPHM